MEPKIAGNEASGRSWFLATCGICGEEKLCCEEPEAFICGGDLFGRQRLEIQEEFDQLGILVQGGHLGEESYAYSVARLRLREDQVEAQLAGWQEMQAARALPRAA